jgi:multidrug resistance efflux pump
MPSEFHQTSTALRADQQRGRRSLVLFAGAGILIVLGVLWGILARVPLYALSQNARLQVRDEVHPVDTQVSGRVISVNLPVGGQVKKGDVLITLDATDVSLRLEDARAAERGLGAQIAALDAEILAREEAIASTGVLGQASLSEAQAARSETEAEATYAARERERAAQMRAAGVVAESEADRANATMVQKQAAVTARNYRLSVLSNETRRNIADRKAENENLRRELAELNTQKDSMSVQVKRLEVEEARHTIRAPIDGLLGQVRAPQVGSVVQVGQTIAVVTPESALELVADFPPAEVIGRVRVGQLARMRVTGFPWTQYGMLNARVSAVSSEVADGRIRVELLLDDDDENNKRSPIPLRHGLVGEVEIELEEVSPAIVLARAAGQLFERSEPQ